jgi:predicted dithiol-disulfide oxidoreductase (DUF899 family)
MTDHKIVGREEWRAAREELLQREKEHSRRADELARQRRELPWVAIEKEYSFDTDDGRRTLADLFDGRSQLLLYHFMFGPSYEAGCPICSSMADGLDGLLPHLHARDLNLVFVSRAPLPKLQAYKQRMGWRVPWVSAANTDFSFDFRSSLTEEQVRKTSVPDESKAHPFLRQLASATGTDVLRYMSEVTTASVFALQNGAVYQTYATNWRGVEFLMGYYPILDRLPKGRDEGDRGQDWVRRHDEYEDAASGAAT